LLALMESVDGYQKFSGLRLANGVREFLLSSSPDFMAQLRQATELDPWRFGFATVHKIDNLVIGLCGFADPPDSDGLWRSFTASRPIIRAKATPRKQRLRLLITRSTATKSKPSALTRSQSLIRQHASSKNAPSKKSGKYFIRKITSSGVGKKAGQDRHQTKALAEVELAADGIVD